MKFTSENIPSIAELNFRKLAAFPDSELRAAEIRKLVDNHVAESDYIEFKDGRIGECQNNNARSVWSKSISAFANSDGGLLVWGIRTEKNADGVDVAREISKVAKPSAFRAWLEEETRDCTNPPVPRIEILDVVESEKGTGGFVVCLIPPSRFRPHRAERSQYHYYIRIGANSLPMSPGNLRTMFYPGAPSKMGVRVTSWVRNQIGEREGSSGELWHSFYVCNFGARTGSNAIVDIFCDGRSVDPDLMAWNIVQQNNINNVFAAKYPMHPGAAVRICSIRTGERGTPTATGVAVASATAEWQTKISLYLHDEPALDVLITLTLAEMANAKEKTVMFSPREK